MGHRHLVIQVQELCLQYCIANMLNLPDHNGQIVYVNGNEAKMQYPYHVGVKENRYSDHYKTILN